MISARTKPGIPFFLALAVLVIAGTAFATPPSNSRVGGESEDASREVESVVEGNNAFALDLYSKLAEAEGNLFFSPSSISTALAMTYAGARGDTADQMARVLHFQQTGQELHAAFHDLTAELQRRLNEKGNELNVANALWGQKGFDFLQGFIDLTRKYYGAGLHEVDYEGATEEARQTINAWVEKETKGKIKNLIPPGAINAQTRLVLTNAIYFFGKWAVEFDQKNTKDAPFTLMGGDTIEVPMMNRTGDYWYMENEAIQALQLPYVDNAASMVIFLPKTNDGLPDLEAALSAEMYNNLTRNLRRQKVVVTIPKFTMTSQFSLRSTLSAMGMKDAFTGNADFSGMTGEKNLCIDNVIHKAFVDVSEKGTEAAAATAVTMRATSAVRQPPQLFRADHPFLFVIRDGKTGGILFMGRVMDPRG